MPVRIANRTVTVARPVLDDDGNPKMTRQIEMIRGRPVVDMATGAAKSSLVPETERHRVRAGQSFDFTKAELADLEAVGAVRRPINEAPAATPAAPAPAPVDGEDRPGQPKAPGAPKAPRAPKAGRKTPADDGDDL